MHKQKQKDSFWFSTREQDIFNSRILKELENETTYPAVRIYSESFMPEKGTIKLETRTGFNGILT